jgi:hypothetical protein
VLNKYVEMVRALDQKEKDIRQKRFDCLAKRRD